MNIDLLQPYLGKTVQIGIPHHFTTDRLFYHEGNFVEIDDELIVLVSPKGIRRIHINDIIEITVLQGKQ